MILKKQKSKPGSLVARFGDWRKGEPTVIVDHQTWLTYGQPNQVEIIFNNPAREKWLANVA